MSLLSDFPILAAGENGKRLVYLDNAATTQHPLQVMDRVRDYYLHDNANPHRGVYDLARRATDIHEHSREVVAGFLNAARSEEIVFTQNTSEAINLVASSYGMKFVGEGDEIVISVSEHHSNLVPWQRVAGARHAKLKYLYPNEDGRYTEETINETITEKTKVVAIAQVSNVLGLINPIDIVVKRAHEVGAVVVLDCAQSVPHMKVDVRALDVDFAAFSGHKIYAPMGTGALYGKYELLDKMPPFMSGGDMINQVHEYKTTFAKPPRKFEAGTRNVGGEAGLAAAIEYVDKIGWDKIEQEEDTLIKMALEGMKKFPEVTIYGDASGVGRKGVISFNIGDVHPHDVASIMDDNGVAIRAGHHCAQPLMDYLKINSCCRVSFALYNTEEDVKIFLESINKVRSWMGLGS